MLSSKINLIAVRRRRMMAIWLTVGLTITIAFLTLIPFSIPQGLPGTDKTYHVLAFAALTLPCAALYPKALLKVMVVAALYGGTIEVLQPYFGRSSELADFLADVFGIGVGASLGLLFHMALKMGLSRRAVFNP